MKRVELEFKDIDIQYQTPKQDIIFSSSFKIDAKYKDDLIIVKDLNISKIFFVEPDDSHINTLFVFPNIKLSEVKDSFYKQRFALGFLLYQDLYSKKAKELYFSYLKRVKYKIEILANILNIKEIDIFFKENNIASCNNDLLDTLNYSEILEISQNKILFATKEEIINFIPYFHKLECKDKERLLAFASVFRDVSIVKILLDEGFKFYLSTIENTFTYEEIDTLFYIVKMNFEDEILQNKLDKLRLKNLDEAKLCICSIDFQNLVVSKNFLGLSYFTRGILKIVNNNNLSLLSFNNEKERFNNFKLLYEYKAIAVTHVETYLARAFVNGFYDIAIYLYDKDKNMASLLKEVLTITNKARYLRNMILSFVFNPKNDVNYVNLFLSFCKENLIKLQLKESIISIIRANDYDANTFDKIVDNLDLSKFSAFVFLKDALFIDENYINIFIKHNLLTNKNSIKKLLDIAIEHNLTNVKMLLLDKSNKKEKSKSNKLKL